MLPRSLAPEKNAKVKGPGKVRTWARKKGPPGLAYLLLATALSLVASGCWDRREINDLAMVSTVAVDLGEEGKMVVTAEFFRPVAIAAQVGGIGGGGAPAGRQSLLATGSGSSIFRAIEDINIKVPREIYWAHANLILVGEELARQGLTEVLDFWDRDPEARRSTHILLARGPAKEVVTRAHTSFERTLGQEVAGLVRRAPQTGYGFIPTVHSVIEDVTGDSRATFLPILILSRRTEPPQVGPGSESSPGHPVEPPVTLTARLYGAGLFLEDRLVATLDPRETRGLLWVKGNIYEVMISVRGHGEKEKTDIEVTRVGPRVKVTFKGGQPQASIEIKAEGNLAEQQGTDDLTGTGVIRSLERQAATVIKNEIMAALKRAQPAGTDVFGFASALHRANPKEWKKIKDKWPEEFKGLPVQVNVEFKLRRTGLSGPGLKIGG